MFDRKFISFAVPLLCAFSASTLAASAQDVVVDSKGTVVGTVHGIPSQPWARRQMADGTWATIRIGMGGFYTTQSSDPIYVTNAADCSGAKFLESGVFNYGVTFKNKPTDTKMYFRYPVPPFRKVEVGAKYYINPTSGQGFCSPMASPYTAYVGTTKTIDLSTLGLVPPFTIR